MFTIATMVAACLMPFREAFIWDYYEEWLETNAAIGLLAAETVVGQGWVDPNLEPTTDIHAALTMYCGDDLESGTVLDGWGNPIWLRPSGDDSETVLFVSFGPNGRDDHGHGDDVVVGYDNDSRKCHWSALPAGFRFGTSDYAWLVVALLAAYPLWSCVRRDRAKRKQARHLIVALFGAAAPVIAIAWAVSAMALFTWDTTREPLKGGCRFGIDRGVFSLRVDSGVRIVPNCMPYQKVSWGSYLSEITEMSVPFAGFRLDRSTFSQPGRCTSMCSTKVVVPLWMPLLLTLLYPFPATVRLIAKRVRRRGRLRRGECLHCGYNLTGLVEPRCPECGTPFDEADGRP